MSISKSETMIPFKNEISVKYENMHFPLKPQCKSLVLEAKPKLWSVKYFHADTDCYDEKDHKAMPKVGEAVTVYAIYGNSGPTTWKTDGHATTVEDYFTVARGLNLTVKDISVSDCYELWVWVLKHDHDIKAKELKKDDILYGGKTYVLQLRKKTEHGHATPYFDIPCYSVNSFAITFLTSVECDEKETKCCKEPKKDRDYNEDKCYKDDKYDKYDKDDKYDKHDKCDKEPKYDKCEKEPKYDKYDKCEKEPKYPKDSNEKYWGKITSFSLGDDLH